MMIPPVPAPRISRFFIGCSFLPKPVTEELDHSPRLFIGQAANDPPLFPAAGDDLRKAQHAQALGDIGDLPFDRDFRDLLNAEVAAGQDADDAEARLVGNELEETNEAVAERVALFEPPLDCRRLFALSPIPPPRLA